MYQSALLMALANLACLASLFAQSHSSSTTDAKALLTIPVAAKADYQPSPEKKFDLRHVKLDVRFDYQLKRMPGKALVTIAPHFYPQSKLELDAKGMLIHKVALVSGNSQKPLSYDYSDSLLLRIQLDKTYQRNEAFTVAIEYTARPDEIKVKGSAAITDAKGLYFINPDGKDSTKPIQIWTQGETEATSVWCPIIDKPNQKTTQEISMTVPARYVSLSNGILVKQVTNSDSTRTDTWKLDLPHSPYLFFMGVGDYAVIRDKYKSLPVDYYVEKAYEPVARRIFGDTPAMIEYFGKLLGVEYPWPKYAQIVGRDYVSGAMENTTATLHGSAAYQNARQLKDGNQWEIVVAHELFHQWFGDLVTAESWSNLTVNESFADYSEYLWLEHKYGKDHALAYNNEAMKGYFFGPGNSNKHLVRFQYKDKEEMFDGVSYQKGGRIQNMLRRYVGDSAYFKAMQWYLQQNKFKNGEAHQWRLALEEISGKDLNWFFDQWYFGSGHPTVNISYQTDESTRTSLIIIEQQQREKFFSIPVEIDIYTQGKASRLTYWTKNAIDTIGIHYEIKPDWINVDPEKMMLWEKKNNQDEEQWLAQATYATNYIDKLEVLEYLQQNWKNDPRHLQVITNLLRDSYFGTRKAALNVLRKGSIKLTPDIIELVEKLASSETNLPTRAYAIDVLAGLPGQQYQGLYEKAILDSSYSVAGAALEALARTNATAAVEVASTLKADAKGRLSASLKITDYLAKDPQKPGLVLDAYRKLQLFQKITEANAMLYYANQVNDIADFKKTAGPAIEAYKMLRMDLQGLQTTVASTLHWMIRKREEALQKNPEDSNASEQLKYLKEKSGL